MRRVYANDRQVRIRIVAQQPRCEMLTIRESDLDLFRMMNYMAVGQDEPVGRENETRTAAPKLIRQSRSWCGRFVDLYIDYGWSNFFRGAGNGGGVSVQKLIVGIPFSLCPVGCHHAFRGHQTKCWFHQFLLWRKCETKFKHGKMDCKGIIDTPYGGGANYT